LNYTRLVVHALLDLVEQRDHSEDRARARRYCITGRRKACSFGKPH